MAWAAARAAVGDRAGQRHGPGEPLAELLNQGEGLLRRRGRLRRPPPRQAVRTLLGGFAGERLLIMSCRTMPP